MTPLPRYRFPLLALGFLALLAALWAGLLRMGWAWPNPQSGLIMAHGPLMVCGFLGTVIGLERAVALNKAWMYLAPFFSGLGGLLLIVGAGGSFAPLLMTAGSLLLVAVFAVIVKMHRAIFTLIMAGGALMWLAGNLLWLAGTPIAEVNGWWSGFLLLTIVGERLELNRVLRYSAKVKNALAGFIGLYALGTLFTLFTFKAGLTLSALAMLLMAGWLLYFDIARRTIRTEGVSRYIAACLLSGYIWLGASALLSLYFGPLSAGPYYDAILHTFHVGFVMSMIFGHAPIIFPAVLSRPLAYRPIFYAPLVLLHLSLLLRVGGDLAGSVVLRQWGGLLNAIAILFFMAVIAVAIRKGK